MFKLLKETLKGIITLMRISAAEKRYVMKKHLIGVDKETSYEHYSKLFDLVDSVDWCMIHEEEYMTEMLTYIKQKMAEFTALVDAID